MSRKIPLILSLKGFRHGSNAVSAVLKTGRRFSVQGLVCFVEFTAPEFSENIQETEIQEIAKENSTQPVFLAVVPKKRTRPAAKRNRIKRLLREAFRSVVHEQGIPAFLHSIVIVSYFDAKHPMQLHLSDILPAMSSLIMKIHAFVEKRQWRLGAKQ